jgi:thiamine transport system ATP-binding protein
VLRLTDVVVTRNSRLILDHVSLTVTPGERVALHGPSGCGKTTLLHAVAGLVDVDSGEIRIDQRDVTNLPANQRNVGLVFQDNQLFPHFNVAENVGYSLRVRGVPRRERSRTADYWLERLGLTGFADRTIESLSGGEAKRVALARTLAANPRLVLLDEPLTGLDEELHDQLLDDLRALFSSTNTTVVHVTHDRSESARLCDRSIEFASLTHL